MLPSLDTHVPALYLPANGMVELLTEHVDEEIKEIGRMAPDLDII